MMKKSIRNFKNTLRIYEKRKKFIVSIFLIFSVLFPLFISLRDVFIDSIPFWYDPARDMLMAWDNLHKFTLIGPPSGIPGIFYGPQWIWLLSFGLLFSKDPRVVDVLIITIPFFTIFPYLFFKFAKIFGNRVMIILWLFYVFAYKQYTTYIWSPHLAPLFFLGLIYLLVFTDFNTNKYTNYIRLSAAGIFAGILINAHISFGVVITIASVIFLLAEFFITTARKQWRKDLPKRLKIILFFALGFLLSISPNLIFEMRHGFHQIQSIIYTVSTAFIYHPTVTGLTGLSKTDIFNEFLGILGKLLHTPKNITWLIYLLISVHIVLKHKSYLDSLTKLTQKLFLLLYICTFCLFTVYLTSKNPIWSYHFVGSEIVILFFLGLVLSKFDLLKNIFTAWIVVLILYNIYLLTLPSEIPFYKMDNLATKKHIADIIYADIKKEPFAIWVYSPAIYTFDYDYIFHWYGTDIYPNQTPKDIKSVKTAYLIIPKTSDPIRLDFINYRTSNSEFKTIREWNINDGTTIIKRGRIK